MLYYPIERRAIPAQKTGKGSASETWRAVSPCDFGGNGTEVKQDYFKEFLSEDIPAISLEPRYLEPEVVMSSPKPGKDTSSWRAIKRSGSIKMTNHSAGGSITTNYAPVFGEVLHPIGAASVSAVYLQIAEPPNCSPNTSTTYSPYGEVKGVSSTLYRTSLDYVFDDIPHLVDLRAPLPDTSVERNSAMSSVVNDLRSTYDLLTEVGEFSETSKTILALLETAKRPLTSMKKAYADYKRNPTKYTASAWMQYRYALMPIYYSVNDALDIIRQRQDVYKTARASGRVSQEFPERDMSVPHLYNEGSLSVHISATGKARYSKEAQRLLAQTAFNPFVTAWELTKFSWMIDWFVNVGDFIGAQAHQYTSMSTEEVMCISEKWSGVIETRLYIPPEEKTVTVPWRYYHPYLQEPEARGFKPHSITYDAGCDVLLRKTEYNSYRRNIFHPGDVSLALNPYLNWKRGLDAIALASSKFTSSMRRFK